PGEGSTFSFTVPIDDPTAVVASYLTRLARSKQSSSLVAAIKLALPAEASLLCIGSTSTLLQQQVRRAELLLQSGPREWTLLTAEASREALPPRIRALRHAIDSHPSHTADQERHPIEVEPRGTWRLPDESDAVAALFGGGARAAGLAASEARSDCRVVPA